MSHHRLFRRCEVAIIGTGPYGLSLAAHLRARKVGYRIFGKPMDLWRSHMPKGMMLKSEGFASSLSAPDHRSTLKDYCREHGKPYADQGYPVPLQDFIEYADWFRARHVPDLEDNMVTSVERSGSEFLLQLDSGEVAIATHVVLAVGITWFQHLPAELAQLPGHLISHSYDHRTVDQFKDREVIVVGAGASAINLAYELGEAGSSVRILARGHDVEYHEPPGPKRSLWDRLLNPASPIGSGWRSLVCAWMPDLLYHLPASLRGRAIRSHLRPAAGWFMRDKVKDRIPSIVGSPIRQASVRDGRVALHLGGLAEEKIECDHVIAATGYRIDLDRLPFLGKSVRSHISKAHGSPRLSKSFETTQPGLYVIGPLAMENYGPMLRFMAGAEFAAPRLARALDRTIMLKRLKGNLSAIGRSLNLGIGFQGRRKLSTSDG